MKGGNAVWKKPCNVSWKILFSLEFSSLRICSLKVSVTANMYLERVVKSYVSDKMWKIFCTHPAKAVSRVKLSCIRFTETLLLIFCFFPHS